jgi:cysteine desulfurase
MQPVYLDWNATTPPHADVLGAMAAAAERAWANPSSLHAWGRAAKAAVEEARESVAELVGYAPRDVVLTSGGTEANNLALCRPFTNGTGGLRHGSLITSRLEHPSVTSVAEALAHAGVTVVWLPVPLSGRIDPEEIDRALEQKLPRPILLAVQAVNHETGVVQSIAAIVDIARRREVELHVDAVQAVGRLPAEAWRGADSVSMASHKMRGPKGIGAIAVRPGLSIQPILRGGGQERGLRPGTVDPVAAAGFGAAARRALTGADRYRALAPLRDRMERALIELGATAGVSLLRNGHDPRAPHVTNLSWPGWAGDELVAALDLEGLCVSAGAACAAGTPEPSPVIAAMAGMVRARSALRVSLGEETTERDIDEAIHLFGRVVGRYPSSSSGNG